MNMNSDQKKVAIGAMSGISSAGLCIGLLYKYLPTPPDGGETLGRVLFALRMNLIAIIPLFAMIAAVGNNRFLSEAIDPLKQAENRVMIINGRVVDNTLQQYMIFFVGSMALSTLLGAESIQLIQALAIVFVLARLAFWIGYRIHPLYRAPGMAANFLLDIGLIVSVLFLMARGYVSR